MSNGNRRLTLDHGALDAAAFSIEPLFNEYLAVGAETLGRLHNDNEAVKHEVHVFLRLID